MILRQAGDIIDLMAYGLAVEHPFSDNSNLRSSSDQTRLFSSVYVAAGDVDRVIVCPVQQHDR